MRVVKALQAREMTDDKETTWKVGRGHVGCTVVWLVRSEKRGKKIVRTGPQCHVTGHRPRQSCPCLSLSESISIVNRGYSNIYIVFSALQSLKRKNNKKICVMQRCERALLSREELELIDSGKRVTNKWVLQLILFGHRS